MRQRCEHADPVGDTQAWVRGGDRNGKWLQVLKHMVFGFLNSKTYSTAPPLSCPRWLCFLPDSSEPLRCPQLALGASAPVLALGMRCSVTRTRMLLIRVGGRMDASHDGG